MAGLSKKLLIAGTLLVLALSLAAACAGSEDEEATAEPETEAEVLPEPEPTNTLIPHVGTQTTAREEGYKTIYMVTETASGVYGFKPNKLTFDQGDNVRFLLKGDVEPEGYGYHTFTLPSQGFNVLVPARTKSIWLTFDEPGEFEFYCIPHPWMRGTITVLPDDAAVDAG